MLNSKICKFKLNCGVNVIYEHNKDNTTGIILNFPVGSLWEKDNQKGLAHLVEHLAFKDTGIHSTAELLKLLEINGANVNACTSFDFTRFYFNVADEYFANTLDLFVEMLTHKDIPEYEFQKEKSVVIQELHMCKDDAMDVAIFNWYKKAHNIDPIVGFEDVLNKITLKQVYAWFNKYIVREGMTISINTGLSKRRVKKILEQAICRFNKGDVNELTYARLNIAKRSITKRTIKPFTVFEKKADQQNTIIMTFPVDTTWDDCHIRMNMAVDTLTKGLTSILFREIREKYGYCYNIKAFTDKPYTCDFTDKLANKVVIKTSCTPGYTKDCIDAITKVLTNLPNLITADDVLKVKNMRKGKVISIIDHADLNLEWYLQRGGCMSQSEYTKKYNNITLDILKCFVKDTFKVDKVDVSICGPKYKVK